MTRRQGIVPGTEEARLIAAELRNRAAVLDGVHLDDLARDVVHEWGAVREAFLADLGQAQLWDVLDRLATAYSKPPEGDVVYHTGLPRCSHEGWHPRASCTDA